MKRRRTVGAVEAQDARNAANTLDKSAEALRSSQVNYMTVIGQEMSKMNDLFSAFGSKVSGLAGNLGKLFSGAGTLQKALSYQGNSGSNGLAGIFKDASGIFDEAGPLGGGGGVSAGTSTLGKIGGFAKGGLAVAGQVAGVAGAVIDIFKTFVGFLSGGFQKALEDAEKKIDKAVSASMNALQIGAKSIGATLTDLQSQYGAVPSTIPKANWFVGLFGGNGARDDAIKKGQDKIMQQIDQLNQDAPECGLQPAAQSAPQFEADSGNARVHRSTQNDSGRRS